MHSYVGSLDKSLLEATALRMPVITINKEYCRLFGNWGYTDSAISIKSEYIAMRNLTDLERASEIDRRYEILNLSHSLKHWSGRILQLVEEDNSKKF
jgi:hypothetical protein